MEISQESHRSIPRVAARIIRSFSYIYPTTHLIREDTTNLRFNPSDGLDIDTEVTLTQPPTSVPIFISIPFSFPFLSFPFLFRDKNSGQSLSQLIEFQFFSSPASSAAASPGMHFSQAVAIIQSQVGVIKGVQVLYSDTVSQRLLWALANTYFVSNRPLSGSIGRGYSNKFTPGWNPTDL